MYYDDLYEEMFDLIRFRGPLLAMLMATPQVYPLLILSLSIHVLRKKDVGAVKQLIWVWTAIFILGSAWTAFIIYAIEYG